MKFIKKGEHKISTVVSFCETGMFILCICAKMYNTTQSQKKI